MLITATSNLGGMAFANSFSLSDFIALLSVCVAVLAVVISRAALKAARRTHSWAVLQSAASLLLQHADTLGPLTPYGKTSVDEATIRTFLLYRFSRFLFETDRRMKKQHVEVRRRMMGQSLYEFRAKLLERGATEEQANIAIKVLQDIHAKEPYYNASFWDTYFHDWKWEPKVIPPQIIKGSKFSVSEAAEAISVT
jgi:hypothetical protein